MTSDKFLWVILFRDHKIYLFSQHSNDNASPVEQWMACDRRTHQKSIAEHGKKKILLIKSIKLRKYRKPFKKCLSFSGAKNMWYLFKSRCTTEAVHAFFISEKSMTKLFRKA